MTLYVVVLLSSCLVALSTASRGRSLSEAEDSARRVAVGPFLVWVILGGVAALRWRVGTDYWAYEANFEDYVQQFRVGPHILGEPGIRFFAWLADVADAGSAGMFGLAALFTVGLMVRGIWRWSPAFSFSIAVYFLSGGWHGSFNGVRQFVAAAILFAGHRYIVDRRVGRWVLVVCLATLFHVSALVGLLLYWVPNRRVSPPAQLIIFAGAIVAMLGTESLLQLVETFTGGGLSGDYVTRDVNPLRVAFSFVPLVLAWILPNRESLDRGGNWFYANLLLISAASSLSGASSAYLTRFAIYPLVFLPLGVAAVTEIPSSRYRIIVRWGLLVLMAIFFYVEVSNTPNLINFQWIFDRT